MTDFFSLLPGYLEAMEQGRTARVTKTLERLTPREVDLIKEAAVMGYVQGQMGPGLPRDAEILHRTILGCLEMPDIYPLISGHVTEETAEEET